MVPAALVRVWGHMFDDFPKIESLSHVLWGHGGTMNTAAASSRSAWRFMPAKSWGSDRSRDRPRNTQVHSHEVNR